MANFDDNMTGTALQTAVSCLLTIIVPQQSMTLFSPPANKWKFIILLRCWHGNDDAQEVELFQMGTKSYHSFTKYVSERRKQNKHTPRKSTLYFLFISHTVKSKETYWKIRSHMAISLTLTHTYTYTYTYTYIYPYNTCTIIYNLSPNLNKNWSCTA